MRRRLAVLFASVAALTLGVGAQPASAHLGSPYLYMCGSAGKYGCASFEWTLNSSIFGWYYNNYHIHTCTDKGGNAIYWERIHTAIAFTLNPPQLQWIVGQSGTTGNFTMCGASSGQAFTYDEPGGAQWWTYLGNNKYSAETFTAFPNNVSQDCLTQVTNFSNLGSTTYGNLTVC